MQNKCSFYHRKEIIHSKMKEFCRKSVSKSLNFKGFYFLHIKFQTNFQDIKEQFLGQFS